MKQYHNTIEAIHASLEEILETVQRMGTEEQSYHIDIDLSLDKLREVYDLMLALRKEGMPEGRETKKKTETSTEAAIKVEAKKEVEIEVEEENQNVTEVVKEETVESEVKKEVAVTKAEEREKVSNEIKEEIIFDIQQKKEEQTAKTKISPSKSQEDKSTLSDKYKSEKLSLNDELSHKHSSGDITSKVNAKPIADLTSGIGLNDKFEFINNLFNRDKALFDTTMEKLNLASNFNDAYNYLSDNFKWDMQDEYVKKLLELIRRKLISA